MSAKASVNKLKRDVIAMQRSTAQILNANLGAPAIAASAARMSTMSGTALDIYARSGDRDKDLRLIGKVLASGHKSVIEHQTVSIAFNDVSVMVEQFVIEFRLASFTVKSRRYVDFSAAGYVVPDGLGAEDESAYRARMDELFAVYSRLLELGVPKEDARFVLPYSLRSNFFVTINARELIQMVAAMLSGRGARFAELRSLGQQLKTQFDELYPNVIDAECANYVAQRCEAFVPDFAQGHAARGVAHLIDYPRDAKKMLVAAMDFSARVPEAEDFSERVKLLLNDSRPRELETLNYTFMICDVSLACLTHFTRHRIQSPLIPDVVRALRGGNYVMPQTIAELPAAKALYERAFADQTAFARSAAASGMGEDGLCYLAMSGHVLDFMMTLNARELLHFAKLRTCTRAQWEIRWVARGMLAELGRVSPEIFENYGPSCAVTGRCPEGRMSCGHPVRIIDGQWVVKTE